MKEQLSTDKIERVKKRRQDKWNENNGLVSKTYKLNKTIVDDFAEACKAADVSLKSQLEKMMQGFIEETKKDRG